MTNNNWNTVNWDEIPDDVDAVVTFAYDEPSYYKTVGGEPQVQCYRANVFSYSTYGSIESAIEYFGDRFHLRPTPTTQPTPEPTESTQVETSEVEATTTPEFDWSSVEGDVEAVLLNSTGCLATTYKHISGDLHFINPEREEYKRSLFSSFESVRLYLNGGSCLLLRPPATLAPEVDTFSLADIKQLNDSGCFDAINENPIRYVVTPEVDMYDMFKETIRGSNLMYNTPPSKPSISTILHEAQQSILKHHGVTGEVKFTVVCSE